MTDDDDDADNDDDADGDCDADDDDDDADAADYGHVLVNLFVLRINYRVINLEQALIIRR